MNKALIAIFLFVELLLLITSPLAALASLMFIVLISAGFWTVWTVVQAFFNSDSKQESP
jgi:hypothetical protein